MNYQVCVNFDKLSVQEIEKLRNQLEIFGSVALLRNSTGFIVTSSLKSFAYGAEAIALEAGYTIRWRSLALSPPKTK